MRRDETGKGKLLSEQARLSLLAQSLLLSCISSTTLASLRFFSRLLPRSTHSTTSPTRAMSLLASMPPSDAARLKTCITPSRDCIPPPSGKLKGKKSKGDVDLPDFKAPEPKTPGELREWDRMSSRMEGQSFV